MKSWYGIPFLAFICVEYYFHVSYGDGSPLSFREMGQIRKVIHRNMVFNQWQKGDLLMIDNFSTSHGREPTYDKNRKIVVAWSFPVVKSDDPVYGSSDDGD
jgi:hypothetical protein